MAKAKITNTPLPKILEVLGAFFNLPANGTDRETGQPTTYNELAYAQEAVLRSIANALFYQLKSATTYHDKAVQIGRDMLNSTRHGADLEDRFTAQRERILSAQARVEIIRSAFKDATAAYVAATGKDYAEPAYTPREKAPVSGAAADLAALVGQPMPRGRDMDTESGDHRELAA